MSEQLCRPIAAKVHDQQLVVDEALARHSEAHEILTRLCNNLQEIMVSNRVGSFVDGEYKYLIIGKTLMISPSC